MESETPDTGTEHGTMGSLEMIHEEAKEINRSMDISMAFWGHNRDQPDMIPATRLKCIFEKSSRAAVTAAILWEKMGQEELEEVKQVETVLMRDGEISTELLFNYLKNIIEGVGLTLDHILSSEEGENVISLMVSLMAEILYIYNQNEPPEISETEGYFHGAEEVFGMSSLSSEEPTPIDCDEEKERYISKQIEFLLEKSKELNLGEINIPSSPVMSARAKLSNVERQVKAKLRLRNIRRLINTKNQKDAAELGGTFTGDSKATEIHVCPTVKKERNRTKHTNQKRPVFRTAVKPQNLEYDVLTKKGPNLEQRLKKASQIRRRLAEHKLKEQSEYFTKQVIKGQNTELLRNRRRKSITTNTLLKKANKYDQVLKGSNSAGIEPHKERKLNTQLRQNIRTNNAVLSTGRELDLFHAGHFTADEQMEFYSEGHQESKQILFKRLGHNTNMNSSHHPQNNNLTDNVSSIKSIIMSEYDDESEDTDGNKRLSVWRNNLEYSNISEDQNCGVFSERYNARDYVNFPTVRAEDRCENVENNRPWLGRKSEYGERPCSRDEMLREMKKMLKEALKEVANPKTDYQKGHLNSLEFTGDGEGPSTQELKEENALEMAISTQCQTTDSVDNLKTGKCQPSCTCCELVKEETKVDIERSVKSDEDIVDIKVTQEGALTSTCSVGNEQDRKMSTEISVSQNGSVPSLKVSVISRMKSQETEPALTHRNTDELECQGNVTEAINVLKDFIKVTVSDNNEIVDEKRFALDTCQKSESKTDDLKALNTDADACEGNPPLPRIENETSQLTTTCLDAEFESTPPINVNLAMVMQECSCFPPRDDFRTCGPFQIGGLLLSDVPPPRLEGDIGDGNDMNFANPWTDPWSNQVWTENFPSAPIVTETDSLYVNTSEDALDSTESKDSPTNSSSEIVVPPKSFMSRLSSSTGRILADAIGIIFSPVTFGFCFLKYSVNRIFGTANSREITDKNGTEETSPT